MTSERDIQETRRRLCRHLNKRPDGYCPDCGSWLTIKVNPAEG